MKLILPILMLGLFFASCSNNENINPVKQENVVDTLYLPEGMYRDTVTNTSNLIRHTTHQTKTEYGLPKNDTILYSVRAKDKLKHVLDHCDMFMEPADKGFDIQKIDNQHFKIFIHPDYEGETIRMDVSIAPQKGFVLKAYFDKEIIQQGQYTGLMQFAEMVE